MIFRLIKVTGQSLSPAYQDGDFVFVSKIPILFKGICPGDVVVFRHPHLGLMIKQVQRLEAGGRAVFVVGLHADSVDSRTFGALPRGLILGKVLWHIRKK